jgi:hypothetical protein
MKKKSDCLLLEWVTLIQPHDIVNNFPRNVVAFLSYNTELHPSQITHNHRLKDLKSKISIYFINENLLRDKHKSDVVVRVSVAENIAHRRSNSDANEH